MDEFGPMGVDADARRHQLGIIGGLRRMDQPLVHRLGHDQVDLHPAHHRRAHRIDQVIVGNEIGRHQHHMAARLVQLPHQQRLEPFQRIIGPARQQLRHRVAGRLGNDHRPIGQLVRLHIPVGAHQRLQLRHHRPGHPRHQFLVDDAGLEVARDDILRSDMADHPVDHEQLAMVAHVAPCPPADPAERQGGAQLHPRRGQHRFHPLAPGPRSDRIIHHLHGDATLHRRAQRIGHPPPHRIIGKDIDEDAHAVPRGVDVRHQPVDRDDIVKDQVDPVAPGRRHLAQLCGEVDDRRTIRVG